MAARDADHVDDPQRWQRLLDDVGATLRGEAGRDLWDEVAERTRFERGRIGLVDRLRAGVGRALVWHLADGSVKHAVVLPAASAGAAERHGEASERAGPQLGPAAVGNGWALVRQADGCLAVAVLVGVDAVAGLSAASLAIVPTRVEGDVRAVMRALSRDRVPVRVSTRGGFVVAGSIDWVGADFLEVLVHPLDGLAGRDGTAVTVPLGGLVWVSLARGRSVGL